MHTLTLNTEGIWQPLKKGDRVAVVAPARRGKPGELELIRSFLSSWGLEAHIPDDLLGEDLLCANTDEKRFQHLIEALNSPDYAAVWCLRGGYGCTRLMPELIKLNPSEHFKWFIGFSDITVLHSWLNDHWHWPTLHGPGIRQLACQELDELSVQSLKNILLGQNPVLNYSDLVCLNKFTQAIQAPIVGGNLAVLESSIGTPWEFNCQNKILLIEEINEDAYRVDRSLNHLLQAHLIQQASAIILGDFMNTNPEQEKVVNQVLPLFANQCTCPVFRLRGIGHGRRNLPIPLNIKASIQ